MVDISTDRLGARIDDFYAMLMDAHRPLNAEQSAKFNARLVLILANAVGDFATLQAAIARAAKP